MVKENIPIDWVIDFEKLDVTSRINRNAMREQPRIREIMDQLEQIEASEHVQKRIDDLKIERSKQRDNNKNQDRDRKNNGNERRKNMCRIPGYNHEWKDCPNNPKNKRNRKNNANEREENQKDEPIESDDFFIERESFVMNLSKMIVIMNPKIIIMKMLRK